MYDPRYGGFFMSKDLKNLTGRTSWPSGRDESQSAAIAVRMSESGVGKTESVSRSDYKWQKRLFEMASAQQVNITASESNHSVFRKRPFPEARATSIMESRAV